MKNKYIKNYFRQQEIKRVKNKSEEQRNIRLKMNGNNNYKQSRESEYQSVSKME